MGDNVLRMLSERYPFITLCRYANVEYVGIIQNQDTAITTIYDFGSIIDPALKHTFIELGNIWWWESNRSVPINIFLKHEWDPFRPFLKTFTSKDVEILYGPACSLLDINKKKSKRRSITLVRKIS